MNHKNIIDRIISLPSDFDVRGNISMTALLRESGYLSEFENITVEDIREQLEYKFEKVEDWLNYSENKRSLPGWFLKLYDSQIYVVGFLDEDGSTTVLNEFKDRNEACAVFIKNEIEAMRKIQSE